MRDLFEKFPNFDFIIFGDLSFIQSLSPPKYFPWLIYSITTFRNNPGIFFGIAHKSTREFSRMSSIVSSPRSFIEFLKKKVDGQVGRIERLGKHIYLCFCAEVANQQRCVCERVGEEIMNSLSTVRALFS